MLLSNDYTILLTDIGDYQRMFLTVDSLGHLWEWGVCLQKMPDAELITSPYDFLNNLAFFHYIEECEL